MAERRITHDLYAVQLCVCDSSSCGVKNKFKIRFKLYRDICLPVSQMCLISIFYPNTHILLLVVRRFEAYNKEVGEMTLI